MLVKGNRLVKFVSLRNVRVYKLFFFVINRFNFICVFDYRMFVVFNLGLVI